MFYNRDKEEHEEEERRDKEKTEALTMALQGVNYRVPKAGGQKLIPGAHFHCGKEGQRENAPRLRYQHLSHVPFVEVIIRGETALRNVGLWG